MFLGSWFSQRGPKHDPWSLTELGDYWHVMQWLEQERAAGRQREAMVRYFRNAVDIFYDSLDRYPGLVSELAKLTGPIYTDPQIAAKSVIKVPAGTTLEQNVRRQEKGVRTFLDKISRVPDSPFRHAWERLVDDPDSYARFLGKLVQDFCNFEQLIAQMPGMGMPEAPEVQAVLTPMFDITTRNIRVMELIHLIRRDWRKDRISQGFFAPEMDMGLLAQTMVTDYMRESDPMRIAAKQQEAKQLGRTYRKYRFWRPADVLRQMAQVEYDSSPKRIPRATRRYVDVEVNGDAPVLCVDRDRMEWAIKEVFNNAVTATAELKAGRGGLIAEPLPRHRGQDPPPAITVHVEAAKVRKGWFGRQSIVRIVFLDEGVGMDDYVRINAPLWAFSTRRGRYGQKQNNRQTLIGGKGIGLAFATAIIKQHGGELFLSSQEEQGTQVVIELPAPTPFTKD